MQSEIESIRAIEPIVQQTETGSWMAHAPATAPVRLGAIEDTEAEARASFAAAVDRLVAALAA